VTSTATQDGPEGKTAATRRHRGLVVLTCAVIVLGVCELGVRVIASHLLPPLQWDTYETQAKVQQIDALSRRGGADVVFFGSSIIDVGVDPHEFDRAVGGNVTSYNAGLVSAIPRLTATWAEHLVIPRLHPKVIVVGLSSYDLGAEDPNRTVFYDAYVGSSGDRQLMGTDDPIQAADRWLGQHSSLWFHKYQLRDPANVVGAVEGHAPAQDLEVAGLSADGRSTVDQNRAYQDLTTVDLKGWRLGAKDSAALKGLISFAHRRGIKVVLVDMPVTPQLISAMPHGAASYQVFNAALGAIGHSTGTPVLFYQTVHGDSLFSNNIHLNHTGAELFSARLGAAVAPRDVSGAP
jgi:hypothetical protein